MTAHDLRVAARGLERAMPQAARTLATVADQVEHPSADWRTLLKLARVLQAQGHRETARRLRVRALYMRVMGDYGNDA